MARTVLLSLMLGVAAVSACGSKSPSGPAVVAGAAAGKVTAVTGAVSARRGDASRPLAIGDIVAGDDVVETGADGRVTILLDHNQVPFSLGPGRTQEVGRSPAWSAPRGTAVAVTSSDRSGAAGRHAEREAADTMASAPTAAPLPATAAAPAPPAAEPAPAPPSAAAVATDDVERPRPKVSRRAEPADTTDDELAAAPPPPPPGGGGATTGPDREAKKSDDAAAPGGGDRRIVGQEEKGAPIRDLSATRALGVAAGTRLVASIDEVEIGGGLAADVVLKKVRSRGLSLRECAGPSPSAVRYTLTLAIAPDGTVSSAGASGGADAAGACMAAELRKLTFAAASAATTARLRLELLAR